MRKSVSQVTHILVLSMIISMTLQKCQEKFSSENYQIFSGTFDSDEKSLPYLVHFSNSYNEFVFHFSGDPTQGNILDYFAFINPNILGQGDDPFVVANHPYVRSSSREGRGKLGEMHEGIGEFKSGRVGAGKTSGKSGIRVSDEDVVSGSQEDYLERYNYMFFDNVMGAGFHPVGAKGK